jgi:hypothetical protein
MQRDYLPVNGDMAYIEDINYNDVRNEGMSFGMMMADQLDKKMNLTGSGNGLKLICSSRAASVEIILPGMVKQTEYQVDAGLRKF